MTAPKPMDILGLDIGSTTSRAVVSRAQVCRSSVTGRKALSTPTLIYQSPIRFTPFEGDRIDMEALRGMLSTWLGKSGVPSGGFVAGGAILTGLAARTGQRAELASLLDGIAGHALITAADDPHLESWLAFQGNCSELSRGQPGRFFLNFDIGGGTTNVALGRNGSVVATTAAFVGARHFRTEAGGYRLCGVSPQGVKLAAALGVPAVAGETLSREAVNRIVGAYVEALESLCRSRGWGPFATLLEGGPGEPLAFAEPPIITFSGGVGELVYRIAQGETVPGTTFYGDLGIDLARGIFASPVLSRHVEDFVPRGLGRATVCGLALHHVEISGMTLFLPDASWLPLKDLPILGRLGPEAGDEEVARSIGLVGRSARGGCLEITVDDSAVAVKTLGERIARSLERQDRLTDRTLVLLVSRNVGKTLGNYATRWGKLGARLVVVDELDCRTASFATLGALRDGFVPVALYGMQAFGKPSLNDSTLVDKTDPVEGLGTGGSLGGSK